LLRLFCFDLLLFFLFSFFVLFCLFIYLFVCLFLFRQYLPTPQNLKYKRKQLVQVTSPHSGQRKKGQFCSLIKPEVRVPGFRRVASPFSLPPIDRVSQLSKRKPLKIKLRIFYGNWCTFFLADNIALKLK